MSTNSDTEDILVSIEQQHRKEKKELQSKIQGLKKTAVNSDKKKKKEILEDILKLETELERKHLKELSLKDKELPTRCLPNSTDREESSEHAPRISKAQKRRDKKVAEEKAREKMILEQEIENINGPRNLEIQTIKNILAERGLTLHSIPSNGDCLYGAVAHQLTVTNRDPVSVSNLRKLTASHIREHKDNFIAFLSDPETGDMLTDDQFEKYCDNVANTTTWGGQVELQALTDILKCGIYVIQSTSPSVIKQGEEYPGNPLVVTYHRHMYKLGEHYNSTKAVDYSGDEVDEFTNM